MEKNWNCTDGVMGKEGWGIKLPCGKGEWEEMFVGAAGCGQNRVMTDISILTNAKKSV